MAKVLLKIKGEDENVVISSLKVKQLKGALKKIKHVVLLMKQNEQLLDVFEYAMSMEKTEEVDEKVAAALNKEFVSKIVQSFDFLLEEFPEEAIELLSALSGIEVEVLDEQDIDTMFDVFEAVVEENDLFKLWNRAKEAFSVAKSKWQVMKAK